MKYDALEQTSNEWHNLATIVSTETVPLTSSSFVNQVLCNTQIFDNGFYMSKINNSDSYISLYHKHSEQTLRFRSICFLPHFSGFAWV